MTDSMLLTMGTFLRRAEQVQRPVVVVAEGIEHSGHVMKIDGHGVALAGLDYEVLVRLEAISAVRLLPASAMPYPALGA